MPRSRTVMCNMPKMDHSSLKRPAVSQHQDATVKPL
jgi:hypothetical protein